MKASFVGLSKLFGPEAKIEVSEYLSAAGLVMALWTALRLGTVDAMHAAPLCLFLYGVVIVLWKVHRLWTADVFFEVVNFRSGTSPYDDIITAKKTIWVTHFSRIVPSESYVKLMRERLSDGVRITRFLPHGIDLNSAEFQWLKEFSGQPHYSEYYVHDIVLPIDIYIFDEHKVIIQFPESIDTAVFRNGLFLRNREAALMFRTALDRLRNSAPRSKRPSLAPIRHPNDVRATQLVRIAFNEHPGTPFRWIEERDQRVDVACPFV